LAIVLSSVVVAENQSSRCRPTLYRFIRRQPIPTVKMDWPCSASWYRGASRITARTSSSQTYEASAVLGFDAETDLAVIQFEGLGVLPLTLGDSDRVQQGDRVTAISAPLGIQETLSDGLVSNLMQSGADRRFQISVAISHGSSGGLCSIRWRSRGNYDGNHKRGSTPKLCGACQCWPINSFYGAGNFDFRNATQD
jgi:hypothetical protein